MEPFVNPPTPLSAQPIPPDTVDKLKQRLKRSVLSPLTDPPYTNGPGQRTYVQNPYRDITTTNIGKAPPSVPGTDPAPAEYLLPDDQFEAKTAKDPTFGAVRGKPLAQRTRVWLDSAKYVAERPALPGYCNLFSMATVAILVADNSPLESGTLVEWLGSGSGARGHMVAVINREPDSEVTDPDSWGDHYLIVDYWYALQTGTQPVFLPRKKAAARATTSPDQHDVFRLFFDEQGTPRLYGQFFARTYKPFTIKEADREGRL